MSEEVGAERPGRGPAKKLYCSLSVLEISVYTATWICGVFYSLYTLYLAGVEQVGYRILLLLAHHTTNPISVL